ncbi:MAG: PIN domain-containing protein [Thermomicrobiales bacterium]
MSSESRADRIVFVDASAMVALADRADASHEAAVAAYEEFLAGGYLLFTTDLAFTAAHQLLLAALGPAVARRWLAQCAIHVEPVTRADLEEGRSKVENGAVPATAPLGDAIHLAVMDRLGVNEAYAVDQQFLDTLAF